MRGVSEEEEVVVVVVVVNSLPAVRGVATVDFDSIEALFFQEREGKRG